MLRTPSSKIEKVKKRSGLLKADLAIALISIPANSHPEPSIRLVAVRRLAYEAVDCGLLSADLAADIRPGKKLAGTSETG
jgi:hypothetical protein